MAFVPLEGSGPADAYLRTDPKPGQQTWNVVRLNFDDLNDRLETLESGGGAGDVVGPASSTDNEIPRYNGATGKLIQSSGITIPDGVTGETLSGTNTGDVTIAGLDYISEAGQVLTLDQIDLETDVTGRLPLENIVQVTAQRLLGRNSGTGDAEELAIGSGLALDGAGLRVTTLGGGPPSMDEITDAVITSPAADEILVYDGAAWVNEETPYGLTGLIDGQYGNDEEFALGACGAAKTVDWDNGNQQYGTLTANCTFTLSNPRNAHRYALVLEQASAGGYSVTFSGVLWMNGDVPDTTSGATGDVFLITLLRTAANSGKYIGSWGSVS